MDAVRRPSLLPKIFASSLIALGGLSALLACITVPLPVQDLAAGLGVCATGFVLYRRRRISTWVVSVFLIWSVVAVVFLALRLTESSSFPSR